MYAALLKAHIKSKQMDTSFKYWVSMYWDVARAIASGSCRQRGKLNLEVYGVFANRRFTFCILRSCSAGSLWWGSGPRIPEPGSSAAILPCRPWAAALSPADDLCWVSLQSMMIPKAPWQRHAKVMFGRSDSARKRSIEIFKYSKIFHLFKNQADRARASSNHLPALTLEGGIA